MGASVRPMGSTTSRTTTLAAALLLITAVSAGGAATAATANPEPLSQTGFHSHSHLPGAWDGRSSSSVARTADANADAARAQAKPEHLLSTLGSLALGIIGLLWVRRHTAEL
jgi:hypothetical protein